MQFYNAKNSDARPIPEELVLGLILQRQYVSFVELIEYLEERHYEARGDWQISLGEPRALGSMAGTE